MSRRSSLPTHRRGLRAVLGIAAFIAAASACAGGNDDAQLIGYELDPAPQVGDLSLDDATAGTSAPLRAADNQLLITFFGFTNCPDVCPTTMAALATTVNALGDAADRVDVAMVTVDPIRDTPAVLAEFVESFVPGAKALRSDDPAALRAVADRLGVSYVDTESMPADTAVGHGGDHAAGDVGHTSYIYVLDDAGSTVLVWPEGTAVADMTSDLGILLERVDTAT